MDNRGMRTLGVLGLMILAGLGCHRGPRTTEQWAGPTGPTAPTWGRQVEGLQCRVRPIRRLWEPGQTLSFKVDLRNASRRIFAVPDPIRPQRIAVDGRWYPWPGGIEDRAKVRPLRPGAELADLSLKLPQSRYLPLRPGRHQIQIVLDFEGIEVTSGSIGIEIAAAL